MSSKNRDKPKTKQKKFSLDENINSILYEHDDGNWQMQWDFFDETAEISTMSRKCEWALWLRCRC